MWVMCGSTQKCTGRLGGEGDLMEVGRRIIPGKKSVVRMIRANSHLALWSQEVLMLVSGGQVGEGETACTSPLRLAQVPPT